MKLPVLAMMADSCCGVVFSDTQSMPDTSEHSLECAGASLGSKLWRSANICGWYARGSAGVPRGAAAVARGRARAAGRRNRAERCLFRIKGVD